MWFNSQYTQTWNVIIDTDLALQNNSSEANIHLSHDHCNCAPNGAIFILLRRRGKCLQADHIGPFWSLILCELLAMDSSFVQTDKSHKKWNYCAKTLTLNLSAMWHKAVHEMNFNFTCDPCFSADGEWFGLCVQLTGCVWCFSRRCPSWRGDVSPTCPELPPSEASAPSPGKRVG